MIIYVESKVFPKVLGTNDNLSTVFVFPIDTEHRTFVVRVKSSETIARVRAQILHILYELGCEDHQFRLRFNGEYLRDAYTLNDYNIVENALLKMVPLAKSNDSVSDLISMSNTSTIEDMSHSLLPQIKHALEREVFTFDRREKLIFNFKSLLYLHFLAGCLCFLTVFWYSGLWTLLLWLLATIYCPTFTRTGGFIGTQSHFKDRYCILYGVGAVLCAVAAVYFCVSQWILVIHHGCKDWTFVAECSNRIVYTAVFFGFEALLLIISMCMVFILLHNMRLEYGDHVERYLVQTRDIEDIMKTARSGRTKERRIAAFELATMAASDDDNKFRIVAEGGLDVLIQLALVNDSATQEHAVEAIAELITVPVILENYVEMGGVRNLMALLHSSDDRLVYQVATCLSYIIADSEDNKHVVTSDQGLSDLSRAAGTENLTNQRLIAGIFLELVFNTEIRGQMASLNSPAEALIKLCWSEDPETQRYALQTLELLAIECPEMICAQVSLLELLLQLPSQMFDNKVLVLAGKILLYFAENRETCEIIQDQTNCKSSLLKYARTKDSTLQKVAVKVIYCMLEFRELRQRVEHLMLVDVLTYVQTHAADRDCWDMADQAIQLLNADDDNSAVFQLPSLTTMEKLDKMSAAPLEKNPGSLNSLGSCGSLRSSINAHGSKKGIN